MEKVETEKNFNPHATLRLLDEALEAGKYFHGSKSGGLSELNPELAHDHSSKHGEHMKVVYAAPDDYLLPLILSLSKPINPDERMGLRISGKSDYIRVWSETQNIAFDQQAYIYVVDPEHFKQGNHSYEVYSDKTVSVEQQIEVTPEVVRVLIEEGRIICEIPFD